MKFSSIHVDNRIISDRGTIVLPANSGSITFAVDSLKIVIELQDGLEPSFFSRAEGANRVVFVLIGFNNPLGTAVTMAEVISTAFAAYDLQLMVHAIGEAGAMTRLISYSLIEKSR